MKRIDSKRTETSRVETMQEDEKQLKLNNLFILNYGPDFCLWQETEIYRRPRNSKNAFVKLNAMAEQLNLKSHHPIKCKMPHIFVKELQASNECRIFARGNWR